MGELRNEHRGHAVDWRAGLCREFRNRRPPALERRTASPCLPACRCRAFGAGRHLAYGPGRRVRRLPAAEGAHPAEWYTERARGVRNGMSGTLATAVLEEREAAPPPPVEYPCSDGLPMADSDWQNRAMAEAQAALRLHFADRRERVYVACDTFVYYREGDAGARVAPDVFVVRGVSGENRKSYRVWREGPVPQWVLEVASEATVRRDLAAKKKLYRRLGVREYWQFDPTGETLGRLRGARLEGWALRGGRYEPLETTAEGAAWSAELGLGLEVQGELLRFRDPATGLRIPTQEESEQEARRQARLRQEAQRERDAAQRERDAAQRERDAAQRERDAEAHLRRAAQREWNAALRERDAEARKRRALEAELAALRAQRAKSDDEPS